MNHRLINIALGLLAFTILYNLAEALASVYFGFGANSIALMGFGFDSLIETSAASVMFFSLLNTQNKSDNGRVRRFIGVTFFALAAYILLQSVSSLWARHMPESTVIGIVIAVLSLLIMPLLALVKIKIARKIENKALESEAKETIACSLLSLILLLGLGLNAWLGWWWADSVAALLMIPWLIKEGKECFEEGGCCGHN